MKKIFVFDDEEMMLDITAGKLKRGGFDVEEYQTLNDSMQVLSTRGGEFGIAVLDYDVKGQEQGNSNELIKECIRQGIPVMVRTNTEEGRWTQDVIRVIGQEMGIEITSKQVEFYAVNGDRPVKIQNLVEDVREFIEVRVGSSFYETK